MGILISSIEELSYKIQDCIQTFADGKVSDWEVHASTINKSPSAFLQDILSMFPPTPSYQG